MTEWEKMLSGQLYNPGDPDLFRLHRRAGVLCHRYNAASPEDEQALQQLCQALLGSTYFF